MLGTIKMVETHMLSSHPTGTTRIAMKEILIETPVMRRIYLEIKSTEDWLNLNMRHALCCWN
jgi:hypothetical protein